MAQEYISIKEHEKTGIREPRVFTVLFHNDDFTTMDFVVEVLRTVFSKTETDATAIMLDIHHKGKGMVGRYSFDIAMSKRDRALHMAREEGFPLKITVVPA